MGRRLPIKDSDNYLAVLDGQHRLMAYIKLGLNKDELVVTEPLNTEMSIAALIAEMNICTTTWKGTDYMAAPAMILKEKNEVFEFALQLQHKGFPLSTISHWCTGTGSVKAKDMVGCLKSGGDTRCLQKQDLVSAEHPMVPGGARTVYGCVPI